jgi:hypothetical protein
VIKKLSSIGQCQTEPHPGAAVHAVIGVIWGEIMRSLWPVPERFLICPHTELSPSNAKLSNSVTGIRWAVDVYFHVG